MVTDGLNPFTLLAFLGAVAATGVGGIAIAVALYLKRPDFARRIVWWGGGAWGAYLGLLVVGSLTSGDRLLAPQEEKHICEVDCHLAYSVVGTRTATTLGEGPHAATAQGRYYVVTVRVRFDSETISSRRARDLPLSPNPRTVALVDGQGRQFGLARAGQRAIPAAPGEARPLTRILFPGESYTADLVFDVPADARNLRLVLEAAGPHALIIGHERSLWHGKTTFRIEA
ncbi:MAG: hypothetical protein ACREL9_11795 [Gemmatimonadales bacterium]